MSSTDERKIPKIVLKIGGGSSARNENSNSQETEHFDSIFSTKASELSNEFYKTEGLGYGHNCISLPALLKKINQNAYKSLENVLELMGRMNDIEKKKTLFQVLFRLKEMYLKFQFILEWTKVINEHTALKTIQFKAKSAKSNLGRLIGGIYYDSSNLLMKKHSEPKFRALKDLFTVSDLLPSYFAPSIESLAPKSIEKLSESEERSWLSTLESLLRTEICKNAINIPRKDFNLLSICDGKAKILFLNLFEFEFTLVPSIGNEMSTGEALNFSWFILGVQVDSMKETFKNSLTGIFQFKYNNSSKSSPNSHFFKSIITDCTKYIELFYFEKMFSQFAFLSNVYGKSICSFQKSPLGDWFKFRPWFMNSEERDISVSFSNEAGLKVEGYGANSILIPSISFDEKEAQNIFEYLFESFFINELKHFLNDQIQNGILNNFIVRNRFTIEMELFETFTIVARIDPLAKKVKFVAKEIKVNFEDSLENSIINFNSEAFKEVVIEIKKEIFKMTATDDFSIISCPEISSRTGFCLQLRDEGSLAISINFTAIKNGIAIKFWSVSLNFSQNGFMEINFKEISDTELYFEPPRTAEQLDRLLQTQKKDLLKISLKFSFENLIKSCGIEGEFLEQNNFRICSFGLPNCIKRIALSSASQLIYGKLELEGLKKESIDIGPAKQSEINILLNQIKGAVKLFAIFEHFNFIEEIPEEIFVIESFEPLRMTYKNMTFCLNGSGKIQVFMDELRYVILEDFIESDKFNIYDFYEKLTSKSEGRDSSRKDEEGSPDLTWLSDSFM